MGKRVAILLTCGVIWVVEYKVGAKTHDRHSIDQTMDHALDLKNFHEGRRSKYIVPILVSTNANYESNAVEWSQDHIANTLLSSGTDLATIIRRTLSEIPPQNRIDASEWVAGGDKPTPTIVEAAQALYKGHSVEEISRSNAVPQTLRSLQDVSGRVSSNRNGVGESQSVLSRGYLAQERLWRG
jgi:hypothetical protein